VFDVVTEGLTEWLATLATARAEVDDKTQRVVGMGSGNIKKDWVRMWTGYAHLPHLPRAISYDVESRGSVITGEIGPVRGRLQSGLAPYVAYGTPTSGPIAGPFPAADAEEPRFIKALGDMGEKLLDG
jgi:hypothetical protein